MRRPLRTGGINDPRTARLRTGAGEDGAALLIAMIFLVLMSFIGVAAIWTSSSESGMSGAYRTSEIAFSQAQGALADTMQDDQNLALTNFAVSNTMNLPRAGVNWAANGINATGQITFARTGPPPAGEGFSESMANGNYYVIETTGTGPDGSVSTQDQFFSKIVMKPNT